jgi:hypothetical protein
VSQSRKADEGRLILCRGTLATSQGQLGSSGVFNFKTGQASMGNGAVLGVQPFNEYDCAGGASGLASRGFTWPMERRVMARERAAAFSRSPWLVPTD